MELDNYYVNRFLSSSELDITSEVQVLKAANAWITYDYGKRSKFSKDLLLTVRLLLLSEHKLKKYFFRPPLTRSSLVKNV